MGCLSSKNTAVQTLGPGGADGEEDETGSKLVSRGDSAASKGTADSGVVMENKELPVLPGAVPRRLPPLTSGCGEDGTAATSSHDGGLRQLGGTVPERQKSSDILEELLNQGIIPDGQTRETSKVAGEAYSIMLDDSDVARRRPPARLESLKAQKVQSVPSREKIDEKIRLAEERRKSREDQLKTRLRTMSARVRTRVPVANSAEDDQTSTTFVEPLELPSTSDSPPQVHRKASRGVAEGEESVREEVDGAEQGKVRGVEGESQDGRRGGVDFVSGGGDGKAEEDEELTEVTDLLEEQLLTASGGLESDSSFQHAQEKIETF